MLTRFVGLVTRSSPNPDSQKSSEKVSYSLYRFKRPDFQNKNREQQIIFTLTKKSSFHCPIDLFSFSFLPCFEIIPLLISFFSNSFCTRQPNSCLNFKTTSCRKVRRLPKCNLILELIYNFGNLCGLYK